MLRYFKTMRYALLSGLAAIFATGAAPGTALSAPSVHRIALPSAASPIVVKVHSRHARHKHHRRHHIVDAPFARVETNRHYRSSHRVIVDAPFTHVSVGRHGRRIIAPFVDLWLPR